MPNVLQIIALILSFGFMCWAIGSLVVSLWKRHKERKRIDGSRKDNGENVSD